MVRALTAAVSVRNTRGPKRQRLKPAACAGADFLAAKATFGTDQ